MKTRTLGKWKLLIVLLIVAAVFSSARAVCTSTDEAYYDKFGNNITCPSTNLPFKLFSEVIPISLPFHFTFGLIDSGSLIKPATINCDSFLYNKESPRNDGGQLTSNKPGCADVPTSKPYETHNMTRYSYDWEYSYDAVIIAYDEKEPVPMLIGYNLTKTKVYPGYDKKSILWYTEDPIYKIGEDLEGAWS